MSDDLDTLVHRADLDGLVRRIDGLCAARDWAELAQLHAATRAAIGTGRQLWPAATLAQYRLALWAPPRWAAPALAGDTPTFAIGPLTEVVAQHHTFAELAALIDDPVRAGFVAHERALRGETIPADTPNPLEIPFTIADWEPDYALATYGDADYEAASPARPAGLHPVATPDIVATVDDPDVEHAIRELFDGWTASSEGRVHVVCVEGDARAAVAALLAERDPAADTICRLASMTLAQAMAWLGWAGAAGGANGRRRGAATGRFGAWWLLGALTDTPFDDTSLDDTSLDGAARRLAIRLAANAAALRWWWWDDGTPTTGWCVQLAVDDADSGYAWAIGAADRRAG